MEYPNKEDKPYEYVEQRLDEIEETDWIPNQEKNLAYNIGDEIYSIISYSENFDIFETYDYMFRAFDLVCDLLLKRKDNKDKISAVEILNEYCYGINERLSEIDSLTEGLKEETDSLEAKVLSEEIISKMMGNQK